MPPKRKRTPKQVVVVEVTSDDVVALLRKASRQKLEEALLSLATKHDDLEALALTLKPAPLLPSVAALASSTVTTAKDAGFFALLSDEHTLQVLEHLNLREQLVMFISCKLFLSYKRQPRLFTKLSSSGIPYKTFGNLTSLIPTSMLSSINISVSKRFDLALAKTFVKGLDASAPLSRISSSGEKWRGVQINKLITAKFKNTIKSINLEKMPTVLVYTAACPNLTEITCQDCCDASALNEIHATSAASRDSTTSSITSLKFLNSWWGMLSFRSFFACASKFPELEYFEVRHNMFADLFSNMLSATSKYSRLLTLKIGNVLFDESMWMGPAHSQKSSITLVKAICSVCPAITSLDISAKECSRSWVSRKDGTSDDMWHTYLGPSAFSLPNLVTLKLKNFGITSTSFDNLATMPKLESLSLSMAYPQKSGGYQANQCTDDMVSAGVAEIKELKEVLLPRLKEQITSVVITTSLMRPGDRNKVQRFQNHGYKNTSLQNNFELEDDNDDEEIGFEGVMNGEM